MKIKFSVLLCTLLVLSSCQEEEKPNKPADTQEIQQPIVVDDELKLTDFKPIQSNDTLCFEEVFYKGKEKNRFYAKLFLNGKIVGGFLEYQYAQTPVVFGQIKGELNQNKIMAQYDYLQDGMAYSQIVEFLLSDKMLIQKTGELEEKNGLLILNPKSATWTDTFNRIRCLSKDAPL